MFTSSGSTGGRGGGDAKTIISPNTSFGDIIKCDKIDSYGVQRDRPVSFLGLGHFILLFALLVHVLGGSK